MIDLKRFQAFVEGLEEGWDEEWDYSKVKRALVDSIQKCLERGVGIPFSGGLDSGIIAYLGKDCGKAYTVGLKNSKDVAFSKKAAQLIGIEHEVRILNEGEVVDIAKKLWDMGIRDFVKMSIGIGEYALMEWVDEKILVVGSGAEELFGGYQRFQDVVPDWEGVNKRMWEALRTIKERDLERIDKIAKVFGKEIRAPFLDFDLIRMVMKIPPWEKISYDEKKILLRRIAKELGVPEQICKRKKVAFQYGAGFTKVLKKHWNKVREQDF